MEVHHHPDLHHKKKKWKEYFLEFLMIFIAVCMGFFAESYREHLEDKEKEKQGIESLINCLASDTVQLNAMIHSNLNIVSYLDSFIMLKNADLSIAENKQKFCDYGFTGFSQDWYFKTNDAAMEQLKSSGMLRLIRNHNIMDSIFGYEIKNKVTVAQEADNYFLFKESIRDFQKVADFTPIRDTSAVAYRVTNKFFSFHFKKPETIRIDNNKEKLEAVFTDASLIAAASEAYAQFMQEQKNYGIKLIVLLKSEYNLV